MIKVENIEVTGWEAAIRGMRNPLNSWEKSDSKFRLRWIEMQLHGCYKGYNILGDRVEATINEAYGADYIIGPNDMDLMKRLYQAGTEHRKFMRMIIVTMDITAPLYWWKEFDTYKVGTVTNSCSTMHTLTCRDLTIDDFSHEHLFDDELAILEEVIDYINGDRKMYLDDKDKKFWWQLIQLLPSSYNQKRTVQMSYENIVTIMRQRKGHKLDEWKALIDEFEKLPYVKEITE